MPSNGLNTGVDFSFGLFDANTSSTLNLGDVQSVKETAQKHDISSRPYNAVPKFAYIPDGYSGSMTVVRTGSQMEKLQITLANNFNNGVAILAGYLNKIVVDPNGTVSKFQYTGVVFFMGEIGDVSREKTVTQTITWMASDKQQLA